MIFYPKIRILPIGQFSAQLPKIQQELRLFHSTLDTATLSNDDGSSKKQNNALITRQLLDNDFYEIGCFLEDY